MKGKYERGREAKRKERGNGRSSKAGAKTELAITSSVAKEATASAGNNGACSDGGSGKNECGGSKGAGDRAGCRGSSKMGSLCNGNR